MRNFQAPARLCVGESDAWSEWESRRLTAKTAGSSSQEDFALEADGTGADAGKGAGSENGAGIGAGIGIYLQWYITSLSLR